MLQITIPKPCHQNWGDMTPNEQGRHCALCAKTVVDFTVMSDDAVQYFLLNRQQDKICGRFRNEQLHNNTIHLPQNIFDEPLPLWKHFLAACLLAFGMMLFSCNTTTKGEPLLSVKTITLSKTDSTISMGKPALLPPPTVCATVGNLTVVEINDSFTTGDISVVPLPTVTEPSEVVNAVPVDTILEKISDTLKTKNPSETDSLNCNTKIFY